MIGWRKKQRLYDLIGLSIFGIVLFLAAALLGMLAPEWRWEHHPAHALTEGLGAFAARFGTRGSSWGFYPWVCWMSFMP